MSANLGPQASTKGETTSKPSSKSGYDRLDINKLYKQGKTTEPVAKAVTQKHGMQTLGKAPPARRAGASAVKPEPASSENTNNSSVPQQGLTTANVGQSASQQPSWTNSSLPPPPGGPPPHMGAPGVQPRPGHSPPVQDKSWNGPDPRASYQATRFAQEFPSLDAGSDLSRGSSANSAQPPPGPGTQNSSKSQDNQYGPGPVLRPQTEGSWTQGGSRGPRPPGPFPPQGMGTRDSGPERPNLGGPTPPPMSLGQGGPIPPPPLGAYPMQFRGMAPFMHPGGPPPGPGYFPQGPRFGMPVPPGPPPSDNQGPRDHHHRGRGPPPSMRPTQQFAVKPIIKQEDLNRMDDLEHEGSWATVKDEVDYNKKINFSDDEDDKRDTSWKSAERTDDEPRPKRILERQQSSNERDKEGSFKERENRYEGTSKDQGRGIDQDRDDRDWNKGRNAQFDSKGRGNSKMRDAREDDWRGFDEDPRGKKGPMSRSDVRPGPGPGDFTGKQYSNLPPRLQRQQQQQQPSQNYGGGRGSPSPSGAGNDRDHQRDRDWEVDKRPQPQYRILERNRGDSESSGSSIRDKREYNSGGRSIDKETSRTSSDSARDKELKAESPGKTESLDNREEKVGSFTRGHKFSTSSWADQVDDEDLDDHQKTQHKPSSKETKEERTVPKRVYIQQRKVENMATAKVEPAEVPKQSPQAQDTANNEKGNKQSAAWGERYERERTPTETVKKDRDRPPMGSEKEIILSEKAKQLIQNKEDQRELSDKGRDNKERNDHGKDRDRFSSNQDNESRGDDKVWGSKPRSGRWGSNDFKADNRTPDREGSTSSNRSSQYDQTNAEKSRASEFHKDSAVDKEKETRGHTDIEKGHVDNSDNRNRNVQDDDPEGRGKSGKNRERTGHGVYQPRGGWARHDNRGKPRGGARDYYERPRRNEYERDKEDRSQKRLPEKEQHELSDTASASEDSKDSEQNRHAKDSGATAEDSKSKNKPQEPNKRNARGGGRLQGYGPPSDKPFSSGVGKEEEPSKEKNQPPAKAPTSGPVPLMELGDISPPNMMGGRGRHHGMRGGRGSGNSQPRQDMYSNRGGGGGSKRGRESGAKPLMSLNSNDEKHEGEGETDSHDEDSRRGSKRKDGGKGSFRQNIHKEKSNEVQNQDTTNNNNKGKQSRTEDHPANLNDAAGNVSDNSENIAGDEKKSSKEKLNFTNKNTRNDKQSYQSNKDNRRNKTAPYETHVRSAVPPRFQKGGFSNSKHSDSSGQESMDSWEKSVASKHESAPQPQTSSSQDNDVKGPHTDSKTVSSSAPTTTAASVILDGTTGPLKTMIFENRNFKNVSKSPVSSKSNEGKDSEISDSGTGLELTKDIGLGFGKDSSNQGQDIDFGNFGDPPSSQSSQNISSFATSKPMPIGQNRSFQSHQPSPVSPLAKDLTEKIQSVRQVWEKPAMPSVAEQVTTSSEDFHQGFSVTDSFKSDTSRDFSLQQTQSGYTPGGSPAIAPISKPDTSSPNSTAVRQVKTSQPQNTVENHVGMSSSPFAYSMPQQTNQFGPPAVPSPPTALVYGTSQQLAGHTGGVYQAFPHVDSQVMGNARGQFGQYSAPQGAGGNPYGLNTNMFMHSIDTSYQPVSSYQPTHHQQHSQSGQGHASNRSPGPMPTSGGSTPGVGVMSAMKNQNAQGHHSMPHQVIGGPSQQGYSQMGPPHAGAIPHHQLPPVGHVSAKPTGPGGYTQAGISAQSQLYIPYGEVLNFGGQSYVSSAIRNPSAGGPPPSATPPVQGMQASSSYYSANAGNQVYGGNQNSGLQQHAVLAVAQTPQMQSMPSASQQYGQQFQIPGFNQLQGYGQQTASTVNALNLGGQIIRPGPNAHSHYGMKQGMDMVQQSHNMKSHESMMNPTWSAQGFPLSQGFHGNKGGLQDRSGGGNMGNQRKGGHQITPMSSMGGKYMPNPSYSSQQKGGRFAGPGPIQRPVVSTPVSTGAPGMRLGEGVKPHDNLNKTVNQPGSGIDEGFFLDKLITESQNRSPSESTKVIISSSGLIEESISGKNGTDTSSLSNPSLKISPSNKSPLTSAEQ